jgi:hypothetical protein
MRLLVATGLAVSVLAAAACSSATRMKRSADIFAKSKFRNDRGFALVPASALFRNDMYHAHGATMRATITGKPANHVGIRMEASSAAAPKARKIAAHFWGLRL